jgi:hypothetical protein
MVRHIAQASAYFREQSQATEVTAGAFQVCKIVGGQTFQMEFRLQRCMQIEEQPAKC